MQKAHAEETLQKSIDGENSAWKKENTENTRDMFKNWTSNYSIGIHSCTKWSKKGPERIIHWFVGYLQWNTTENTENQEFCKEKDENIETNDRTVSKVIGLIHGHPPKSSKIVEKELIQEKHTLQKPTDLLDLPRSLENGSFAAIKEIEDFSIISDTDLKELLNSTNFTTNNEDLPKNQKKMTFSAETEEILLDLPSEEAIVATLTDE